MKPRTRLSKFLAKIAGQYDGELEPKTEVEYYLDKISGGGNVLTLYAAGKNPVLYRDKSCTEQYDSFDDAWRAVVQAAIVKLEFYRFDDDAEPLWVSTAVSCRQDGSSVLISAIYDSGDVESYDVAYNHGEMEPVDPIDPGLL